MNIYEGFFFDRSVQEFIGSLWHTIEHQHVTTEYKPSVAHPELYGKKATFRIVGYGNDGENEGFLVRLTDCDDPDIDEIYNKIERPHITISVSPTGKPVNTGKLRFHAFYGKEITLRFGAFNMESGMIDLGWECVEPDKIHPGWGICDGWCEKCTYGKRR